MREPKPYFKQQNRAWYANLGPNRRPVRLASESEGEQVAWKKYHEIMAGRQPTRDAGRVPTLIDDYLDYCQRHNAPSTYGSHRQILQSFLRAIAIIDVPRIEVNDGSWSSGGVVAETGASSLLFR